MLTKVTTIYDYRNIEIPKPFIELQLPDVEAFVDAQCRTLALKHSGQDLPEGAEPALTDEMVQAEELPGVTTVDAYRETLRRDLPLAAASEQSHMILMNYVMPQVVQRSTFEINDEEATRESRRRLEAFEENAKKQGLTLEELGQREFGLPGMDEGAIRQHILYLGRNSFLFRVLAKEYLKQKGQVFDVASYAGYVKDLEGASGMSEDKIRELVPIHIYMEEVPTLVMLDEITAWIEPQLIIPA